MTHRDQASPSDWREYVDVDPRVANGKPIVKGTTLSVETVFQELANGQTIADTIERHPELTPQVMRALFALATYSIHIKHPGPTPDDFYDGPDWSIIPL